jgi:hypothetical protein
MNYPFNLKPLLAEKYVDKPGVIGRYSVSAVWGILNGYTTPEEYIKGKKIDYESAFRMWEGTAKHGQVQSLFEGNEYYEIEKKIEYLTEYNWTLVGKADLLDRESVIELKTSTSEMDKAKKWAEFQCKLYCTMFERPKGIICQPVKNGKELYLKSLGEVERNDKWFATQLAKLNEFHNQLLKTKSV